MNIVALKSLMFFFPSLCALFLCDLVGRNEALSLYGDLSERLKSEIFVDQSTSWETRILTNSLVEGDSNLIGSFSSFRDQLVKCLSRRSYHELSELSPDRILALLFLLEPELPQVFNQSQYYLLVEEVMSVFDSQMPVAPKYQEVLIAMLKDDRHDEVVRDYALQHVISIYWKVDDNKPLDDRIYESFMYSTEGLAGTALLGLLEIAEQGGSNQSSGKANAIGLMRRLKGLGDEFRQRVIEMVSSPQTSMNTRVTALAVAGKYFPEDVLDVALGYAEDEASGFMLRISALGAIHAASSDRTLFVLESLTQNKNSRIAISAQDALERVREKIESQVRPLPFL